MSFTTMFNDTGRHTRRLNIFTSQAYAPVRAGDLKRHPDRRKRSMEGGPKHAQGMHPGQVSPETKRQHVRTRLLEQQTWATRLDHGQLDLTQCAW